MTSVEPYYEAFEEYIANGEKKPAHYADNLQISVSKFLKLVEDYKHMKNVEVKPEPLKVPMEELLSPDLKQRTYLTNPQKEAVYEAIEAGGSWGQVANRFSISIATVRRTWEKIKEKRATAPSETPPLAPSAPVESIAKKILGLEEIGIVIDDEFITIRIPKKKVTMELLKSVL